jgi:hypothetical protein
MLLLSENNFLLVSFLQRFKRKLEKGHFTARTDWTSDLNESTKTLFRFRKNIEIINDFDTRVFRKTEAIFIDNGERMPAERDRAIKAAYFSETEIGA